MRLWTFVVFCLPFVSFGNTSYSFFSLPGFAKGFLTVRRKPDEKGLVGKAEKEMYQAVFSVVEIMNNDKYKKANSKY